MCLKLFFRSDQIQTWITEAVDKIKNAAQPTTSAQNIVGPPDGSKMAAETLKRKAPDSIQKLKSVSQILRL